MLKHLTYTLVGAALLALGSCAADDPQPQTPDGSEATVRFTAEIPAEFQTRAYSDGTQLRYVMCAAYIHNADGTTSLFGTPANYEVHEGLTATVDMRLLAGYTYDFVFFASAYDVLGTGSPYTFDAAAKTVNISYADVTNDSDQRDAFFANRLQVAVTRQGVNDAVTLTRPFAQLNFGTNDLSDSKLAPYVANLETMVTAPSCDRLNLATGDAYFSDPTAQKVTFALASLPDGETYPVTGGYEYIGMDYILPPGGASSTQIDAVFTAISGQTTINSFTLSQIPVTRNYRTNVYGSLLTSTSNWSTLVDMGYNPGDFHDIYTAAELSAALNAGGLYTLKADVDLSQVAQGSPTLDAGKTMVLNMDANLTQSSTFTTLTNNGTLKIIMGPGRYMEVDPNSITNAAGTTADGNIIASSGNLYIEGGTIRVKSGSTGTASNAIFSYSAGSMTIKNVTFECGNIMAVACDNQTNATNGTLFENVTIHTTAPDALSLFDTGAELTGCNIQNTVECQGGRVEFNDCIINGGTGYRAIRATNWNGFGNEIIINSGTYGGVSTTSPTNAVYAIGTGTTLRVNGGEFQGLPLATSSSNSGTATLVLPSGKSLTEIPTNPGWYHLQ